MIIKCKICNIALTNNLNLVTNENLLMDGEGSDYIPKGYYIINNADDEIDHQGGISINKTDIINFIYHKDSVRLQGCCGPAGLDGLNILCSNGHEVATEKSDCWQSHEIVFENGLILFHEEK